MTAKTRTALILLLGAACLTACVLTLGYLTLRRPVPQRSSSASSTGVGTGTAGKNRSGPEPPSPAPQRTPGMAHSFVYFQPEACDLDRAEAAFKEYGLTVTRDETPDPTSGAELTVSRPTSPRFHVSLEKSEAVRQEAADIGEGSPHAETLRKCGARFVIRIEDLDHALDEINTLMEVQGSLQDASRGFLFNSWNGNLSPPEPE